MFFENGFDGTGIRAVMREVGLDVGAFYYYFKTKDELFDEVMADFFAPYRQDFERIAKEAHLAPYQAMLRFFQYIYEKVLEFRERHEGGMHCTVRWAIREQTLTVIEPYLEEILNVMVQYGAKPCMEIRTMAVFLAHGVGSCLLHEDTQWVASTASELRRTVNYVLGITDEISQKMREDTAAMLPGGEAELEKMLVRFPWEVENAAHHE